MLGVRIGRRRPRRRRRAPPSSADPPYAESKVWVEDDLAAIADTGFAPVFLRNATAFGFSPRLRADIVLNNLVGHAVLTGVVKVLSDGTPWRPLVHAQDIAEAFLLCLTAPVDAIWCQAFNVGTEANNLTVAEIAQAVADVVPRDGTAHHGGGDRRDPRSYRVDFAKIRDRLGFQAHWSVAAGASELYATYTNHDLTQDGFTGRFTRLARLKQLRESGVLDETMYQGGRVG